jgi:hypothetical protein
LWNQQKSMLPKNDEKDDTDQTKLHEKWNHNKEVNLSFSSNAWTQLVESECKKNGTESELDGFTDLKRWYVIQKLLNE